MADQEAIVSKLCSQLKPEGILIYTFGDDYGDKEDLFFWDENGKQVGELNNDKFGYGTIGINENLRVIRVLRNIGPLILSSSKYEAEFGSYFNL